MDQQRPVPPLPRSYEQIGGFKSHPNSQGSLTVQFGVDLAGAAFLQTNLLRQAEEIPISEYPDQAICRYYQFMKLKSTYPNAFLVPTTDIEIVWQSHLLRPSIYQADCIKLFGKIIDHKLVANEVEQFLKERALRETDELWRKEYNYPYCTLPDINRPPSPRFSAPPFSGVTNIIPKNIYWDKTSQELKLTNVTNFKNPFGFSKNDLIQDQEWFSNFKKFLNTEYWYPNKKFFKRMEKSYERFLYLAAKYPPSSGQMIHPTYAIDFIWHIHMIHPLIYKKDMENIVGYLVDHDPWPKDSNSALKESFQSTNSLWSAEYNLKIEEEQEFEAWDQPLVDPWEE